MGCVLALAVVLLIMIITVLVSQREYAKRVIILISASVIMAAIALIGSRAFREDLALLFSDMFDLLRHGDTQYAGHGRWELWTITVDYIIDRPFLGYGCEGIADILSDYTEISSAHCEPLTYAAFFGIPAALLYTAGCVSAILSGLRGQNHDCSARIAGYAALGYFVSSLFGVAMFYTVPFFFILMGMSMSGRR